MNYDALSAELAKPAYDGLDDAAILDALNADTVESWVSAPTGDVHNFLVGTGMYSKLLNAYHNNADIGIRLTAETAIDAVMGQIENIDLKNNPMIQALLPTMVTAGVFTQAEADSLLNYAKRTSSIADGLGGTVTQQDLDIVRLMPQANSLRQYIAVLQAGLAQLQTGQAFDFEVPS